MAQGGYKPPALVGEVIKKWDEAQGHHNEFVRRYERSERAYRGVLEARSDAAKWRHKYHPPYAFNLIETIVSNTVEMGLRFDVRPSPHSGASMEEMQQQSAKAELLGDLLRHEHRVDEMEFKQRPLFLSDALCGRGIGKTYWNWTTGSVKRQGVTMKEVRGPDDQVMGQVPVIGEVEEERVIRDHSTTEIVDPRDFVLHESARALQPLEPGGAQHLFHRCWYSYEQLKMLEASGFVKDVDRLKESIDFTGEYSDREAQLWNINKTKDLIEVLEYWCFKNGQVYRSLVGNRAVLLRDEEANPFWHGQYPFFIASSMPQLFSTRGMSDIELVEQLQEMMWELASQRFDNIELINNAIYLFRSDIEDVDAFEFYPGARWPVDDTSQVAALQPPYQVAEVSLQAEALLKGDMQNVTSAAPFAGGTDTQTVDNKTATGASIVMNAAQQRLTSKKYTAQQGLRQEANMRLKNCQQFISDTRLIHAVGMDGKQLFREIDPLEIQGEFIAELEPMGESQMRQERRAEATNLLQVMMAAAPLAAAAGTPMNIQEIIKWTLKQWKIDDAAGFFSAVPQPAMMGGPAGPAGPGGPGQAPAGPEGPNLGTTSSTAVDASSPSATGGVSMSPQVMLQRALAMGGGVQNT